MCLLGSEDSHWLAGKGATFSGVFHPSTIPDLHTCEAGQWQHNTTAQLPLRYLFTSIHFYHLPPPTQHLLTAPTPLIFIQHLSFIFLTLAFAAFHSTCTPICFARSLIFHSHSAAPRLIHKQHHSLQQQKEGRGEGGLEGGLPLLTYWLLHGEGSLKTESSQCRSREEGRVR